MLGKSRIGGIILLVALGLMLGAVIILATGSAVADTVEITITSNPAGPGYVMVGGVEIVTPETFNWEQDTTHTLEAISVVSGGTGERYSFSHWDDGSGLMTYTLTYVYVVSDLTATTITAVFELSVPADYGRQRWNHKS